MWLTKVVAAAKTRDISAMRCPRRFVALVLESEQPETEIVQAVYGPQLIDAHAGIVAAVLAAIRANQADARDACLQSTL